MNQVALYRKYRPVKFSEVVGQDHIVRVLEAAVRNKKINHAYLFFGSRGTGKTSVARIFAKALKTTDKDIYEMDAASNRGVDEVRLLRESVQTLPFDSDYKVYIIDEVHMLTSPAFNALLKTLEEPPAHVIFILATTEFEKLPETIISRCEIHNFRRPSQADLKTVLKKVASAEGFRLDLGTLNLITLLAEGSFRDGLGALQKIMTISDDRQLTIDEAEVILGAPRSAFVNELLEAIHQGDLTKSLQIFENSVETGLDLKTLMKILLSRLRFVMLLEYAPELEKIISSEVSAEELEFLKSLAGQKAAAPLSLILKEFLIAYNELDRSFIKHLPANLALVRIFGDNLPAGRQVN